MADMHLSTQGSKARGATWRSLGNILLVAAGALVLYAVVFGAFVIA